jgi:hypothetical protein
MSDRKIERRAWRTGPALAGTLALGVALAAPLSARAEGPVTPTAKGMVGGGLLGAEVVMISIGIAGVDRVWPYLVFGAVGAGGGVVGGYFVEQTEIPEPSLYMLAGGMALVVPTLVVVLNATSYKPGEDEEEGYEVIDPDKDKEKQPEAEGRAAPRRQARALPTWSLVEVGADRVTLGVPAVELRPATAMGEPLAATELRVPMVGGRF